METWVFTHWATTSINTWLRDHERLLADGAFTKPKLEAAVANQIQLAKEELANRLIQGTL